MITKILFIYAFFSIFIKSNGTIINLNRNSRNRDIKTSFAGHCSIYLDKIPAIRNCLFMYEIEIDHSWRQVNFKAKDEAEHDLFSNEIYKKLQEITEDNIRQILEDDHFCELLNQNFAEYYDDNIVWIEISLENIYYNPKYLLIHEAQDSACIIPRIDRPTNPISIWKFLLIHHEMIIGLLLTMPLIIFSLLLIWINDI